MARATPTQVGEIEMMRGDQVEDFNNPSQPHKETLSGTQSELPSKIFTHRFGSSGLDTHHEPPTHAKTDLKNHHVGGFK